MSERKLIREFLDSLHVDDLEHHHMHDMPIINQQDYNDPRQSSHKMEISQDGTISPDQLHQHFDLDNDGQVTPQEYVDHVQYHADNPETLSHYNMLKGDSCMSVPCADTYDKCATQMINNPSDIESCLKPLMDMTGSSCHHSAVQGLLDAVKTLVKCGIL